MDDSSSGKPAPLADSRTLLRGLQVMDAILAGPEIGMRVADLCRSTDLERATVYRLLGALQSHNYVEQIGRYRYVAGSRWQRLVPSEKRRQDLAGRLAPGLSDVSNSCGDASFAVVRQGGLSHCIARHVGTFPVQVLVIQVGTKQPLGVGAAGLALLSALPDREVESVIDVNGDTLQLYGNMTPVKLRALVLATRERGWSVVGNHATRGVLAVGRPVYGADDQIIAGVSVATTEERLPLARQRAISRLIRQALGRHGFDSH